MNGIGSDPNTIKLLKLLDDKLAALNDHEKQQSFIRNQVELVKKYLNQYLNKGSLVNQTPLNK